MPKVTLQQVKVSSVVVDVPESCPKCGADFTSPFDTPPPLRSIQYELVEREARFRLDNEPTKWPAGVNKRDDDERFQIGSQTGSDDDSYVVGLMCSACGEYHIAV